MRGTTKTTLGIALAALVATGCGGGGGGGSDSPAADPAIRDKAAAVVEQAADRVVQQTPDKNLPGPKNYKVVCLQPGDAGAKDVADNQVRCHIEAFYSNYKGKSGGYIWSEDWVVTVKDGKVSNPVIFGDYRIRNFLRLDNRKNCTGRHRPQECLPADAYPAPPDQGGIGGGG
jgi:hypothetical protein